MYECMWQARGFTKAYAKALHYRGLHKAPRGFVKAFLVKAHLAKGFCKTPRAFMKASSVAPPYL